MTGTRAAVRYAKAILDMADSIGVAKEVNSDMALIGSTMKESAELNVFIQNPTIKTEAKQGALQTIFADVNGVTKGLFRLLFENKRFEILETITGEYTRLFDQMNGVEVATVTTAMPLTAELEAKVMDRIKQFSNKNIVIENIVDESIIGGFVLRIGDKQYNASVLNKLQVLKRELSN